MMAFVKTFLRPESCRACVASIHEHLGIPVIVADDGRGGEDFGQDYLIRLPFDSGISAGRNAAVALGAQLDDVLVMFDDDHVLDERNGIKDAAWLLNEYDIVCGQPTHGTRVTGHVYHWEWTFEFPEPRVIVAHPQHERGVIHAGNNFFIARAGVFEDVLWDARFKVSAEHFDFFLQAYFARKRVFYEPSMQVLHFQDNRDPEYHAHRMDVEPYDEAFRRKWQLADIRATDGTRMP